MNNVIVEFVQKIDGIVVQQFDPILVSFQVGKNGSDANVTPENVSNAIEEFTYVTPTLESEVILGGGQKTTIEEILSLGVSNAEIYIGSTQPENTFKLWIDTSVDDVDILRAIRDANPQSTQLAALFDDTKDPYTEWWDNSISIGKKGAQFNSDSKCTSLELKSYDLTTLNIIGLTNLTELICNYNSLTTIGLNILIDTYALEGNPFTDDEVARLIALGYNSELNND